MRLNLVFAKAEKTRRDSELRAHMEKTLKNVLETDEMVCREDPESHNGYISKLGQLQAENFDPVLEYLKEKHEIKLEPNYTYGFKEPDSSVLKLDQHLANLDPYSLTSLFIISSALKSTALAMFLCED